jgi:hypothetical protein
LGICHLPSDGGRTFLRGMKAHWQVAAVLVLAGGFLQAEEANGFEWEAPKVMMSHFSREIGMLDSEREEYAGHLAGYAGNRVAAAHASPDSLEEARRLLAMALHLSPRNRKALVLSFQLSKGVLPEPVAVDFGPSALAKLLVSRAQLLKSQGGEENLELSRMFVQMAAHMDPRNEDAVYHSEVDRLEHGEIDWTPITDPKPVAEIEP